MMSTACSSSAMDDPTDLFDPLEGLLDVLDIEEEEEENPTEVNSQEEIKKNERMKHLANPTKEGNDAAAAASKIINGDLLQCHPVSTSSFSGIEGTEYDANTNPDVSKEIQCNNKDSSNYLPRPTSKRSHVHGRKHQRSSKKDEANDLAAALFFCPSRPRSHSLSSAPLRSLSLFSSSGILSACAPSLSAAPTLRSLSFCEALSSPSSSSSSTSATSAATPVTSSNSSAASNLSNSGFTNSNSDNTAVILSTTQLLLTLNAHLGHEAASLASELTNGDLNLAQYLIEAARSDTSSGSGTGGGESTSQKRRRPRICRHELHGTCYRSDCPYSHDLAGVTCLFWLRGRCRGGNNGNDGFSGTCRFLHGFGERLLDGICEEYLIEQQAKREKEEQERLLQFQQQQQQLKQQQVSDEEKKCSSIPTTNLLDHNKWVMAKSSSLLPNQTFTFLSSGKRSQSTQPVFDNGCWTAPIVNR